MEHMRDFVTAEAGLLHRSVCTVAALEAQITEAQASTADIISDRMIAYSHALQLEFHDKEMLRWTEEELLRRRTRTSRSCKTSSSTRRPSSRPRATTPSR